MESNVKELMSALVFVVFAVILIPVIYSIIATANVTNPTVALIFSVIPVFIALAVLYATVKGLL